MSRYHFLVSSMALALLLSAPSQFVLAQPTPTSPYCGSGYGNGVMGVLAPEQRMVLFAEVQEATAQLSPNDMRSYRSELRDKVMAMTDGERQTFTADLSAKWKALPPDKKSKLQQDFTAYRDDGRWGSMRMRQGKSMGGCWW